MAADYTIDRALGCVFTRATREATEEDLLDHQARLSVDPDFQTSFNQLVDLREMAGAGITTDSIYRLAKNSPFGDGSRRALVVEELLMHGLTRIFLAHSEDEPAEVRVFGDLAEAKAWLGLDPDHTPDED